MKRAIIWPIMALIAGFLTGFYFGSLKEPVPDKNKNEKLAKQIQFTHDFSTAGICGSTLKYLENHKRDKAYKLLEFYLEESLKDSEKNLKYVDSFPMSTPNLIARLKRSADYCRKTGSKNKTQRIENLIKKVKSKTE